MKVRNPNHLATRELLKFSFSLPPNSKPNSVVLALPFALPSSKLEVRGMPLCDNADLSRDLECDMHTVMVALWQTPHLL